MPGADGHVRSFFAGEWGVDFEGVEGDFAQYGEVGGGFAGAGTVGVLAHEDVEPPVQAVLDAPLGAGQLGDGGGKVPGGSSGVGSSFSGGGGARRAAKAGDIAALFDGGFAGGDVFAAGFKEGDGAKAAPLAAGGEVCQIGAQPAAAGFNLVAGFVQALMVAFRGGGEGGFQKVADGLLGAGLVGFEGEEVVASLSGNLAGGGALGMGGVGGDDGVFQTEVAQQERGLDDLAALLRDAALGEDEALAGKPDVDDGAGALAMGGAGAAAAAAQDFAIHGKVAELERSVTGREGGDFQPGAPVAQGVFELAGIKGGEDAVEGIVAGRASGERQEGGEPALMAEGKMGHIHKGAASREEGAEAHQENFVEEMAGTALPARIGHGGQVARKPAQRGGGVKQGHPLTTCAAAIYNKMA